MARLSASILAIVALSVAAVSGEGTITIGNDIFSISIPGNENNPTYSFTFYDNGDDDGSASDDWSYTVKWQKVYETECGTMNPSGRNMVNLYPLKSWTFDTSDVVNNTEASFSMYSGPVVEKLTWSNLTFTQFVNASNDTDTHIKFDVDLSGYEWQSDSNSTCLQFFAQFQSNNATLNQTCDQYTNHSILMGNGYWYNNPNIKALAYNPQNKTQDMTVPFALRCRGGGSDDDDGESGNIVLEYGHFPKGWVLSHDPTVGVNSKVDPMPGYVAPSTETGTITMSNGIFSVSIPGNGNNPTYSFSFDEDDGKDDDGSDDDWSYTVKWQKVYETECGTQNPKGNEMVNLYPLKSWTFDTSDVVNNSQSSFIMYSGAVANKLTWSNLTFIQFFDGSKDTDTHVKFDVALSGYDWQSNTNNTCLQIYAQFQPTNGATNQSCDQYANNSILVGNGYWYNDPNINALAYNPNNNTENMTVSFDLRCHGGDDDGNGNIVMEYGHFPQGWVLSHDPTVGINSDVDPMPGYTPASPPNGGGPSGFPWWGWVIIGVAAVGVLAVISLAAGFAGLAYYRKKKVASYEEV